MEDLDKSRKVPLGDQERRPGGGRQGEPSSPLREGARLGPGTGGWEIGDYMETDGPKVEDEFAEVKRLRSMQQATMRPSMEVPRGPRKGRAHREAMEEIQESAQERASRIEGEADTAPAGGSPVIGPSASSLTPQTTLNPPSTVQQQKSRRASFIDFFRSKPVEPAAPPPQPEGLRSMRKTSSSMSAATAEKHASFVEKKARRSSFVDFFRSGPPADDAGEAGPGPGSSAPSATSTVGGRKPKARRASILDLFSGGGGEGGEKGAPKSRRASVVSFGLP